MTEQPNDPTELTFATLPAGMHAMAVMGKEGDTKITWTPGNAAEVDNARSQFEFFRGKGYAAFRMSGNDQRGEQMNTFDPAAQRIVFVPPMQGG